MFGQVHGQEEGEEGVGSGKRAVKLMLAAGLSVAEQWTDSSMDSTQFIILFFFFHPCYIQNQFAEPGGGGDAARLFNFISEWIAASGDSHLFVYRLL